MAGAFQSNAFQNSAFQTDAGGTTAADAVTTSDAVTRTQVLFRTASDTVTAATTVARTQTLSRTAADAVTTSSAVAAVAGLRTASDTVTISTAPTRVLAATRTASDTLTISSAVSRAVTLSRTASDTVTTSTTVARTAGLHRTASDTATVSTAVSSTGGVVARTASDTLTVSTSAATSFVTRTAIDYVHATDVAMMSGPIGVSATDAVGIDDFVAQATPRAETTVQILINGIDVSADVVYETAYFKGLVNSKPGEAKMRVRDLYSTYDFLGTEGADWLLLVNGDPVWRGFLTIVKEVFIYSAGNVAESGLQRFWDLEGSDLNILFSRRVVFKESNPATVTGTKFPPGTPDTTAITELLRHWLDLSDDHLDTTSGVENVGDLDPAQPTQAWSGGWYWGDAMNAIAMLPAAIFYIRPEVGNPRGTLVYCDTDVPTAPFGLSDQPNGTTTKGFREMEISLDGTSLANDVLAWGMGYGSQTPVFKREQASGSITTHGRWQQASINNGIYKQASINRVADSIVNGSPENHRGAKSDRPAVRLVTYEPGLLNGHVVTFTSEVWGWTDDIPVRQMEVTFETPVAPRFELLLSHEIDSPWGFIDQFWPQLPGIPPFPYPTPPVLPGLPHPTTEVCDCGITDDFERTLLDSWGTSTSGVTWETYNDGEGGATYVHSVSDGEGLMTVTADGGNVYSDLPFPHDQTFAMTFRFRAVITGYTSGNWYTFFSMGSGINPRYFAITADSALGSGVWLGLASAFPLSAGETVAFPSFVSGDWYNVRFQSDDITLQLKVWADGDPEPGSWTLEQDLTGVPDMGSFGFFANAGSEAAGAGAVALTLDDLDIEGINRCTAVQFDDFNRTVAAGGWGTASGGAIWTSDVDIGSASAPSVTGSAGRISAAGLTNVLMTASPMPTVGLDWTLRTRFLVSPTGWTFTFGILNGGDKVLVDTSTTAGFIDVNASEGAGTRFPKTDWVTGTWYNLVYEEIDGVSDKAKVWADGEAEPDWQSVDTDASSASPNSLTLRVIGLSGYVEFDYIDFDYDDRPCYVDCEDLDLDTFDNRTISPGEDVDLGVSTGGTAWGIYSGWAEVTSGYLRLLGPSDGGPTPTITDGSAILGEDYTIVGADLATDYYFRFRISDIAGSKPSDGEDDLRIVWAHYNDPTIDLRLQIRSSTVGSFTGLFKTTNPAANFAPEPVSVPKFDWIADAWYTVRATAYGATTDFQAKIWADELEDEPAYMIAGDMFEVPMADDPLQLEVIMAWGYNLFNAPVVTIGHTLDIDRFWVASCTDVEPTIVSAPTSPSGFGCETPQRQSSTVYATASPFVPNATSVWVNGLLMTRGSDYTEGSDNQSITFSSSVSTSSAVRICYYVGGPQAS